MATNPYINIFKKSGALLSGHFKLSSGLHSPEYFQCALVLQYPRFASKLGKDLAAKLGKYKPTVVVSPAIGGLIIGQEVARSLGVRAIFTERKEGKMVLRRGFSLSKDDRVVVIEDVITTGLSTKETIKVIKSQKAKVVGVGSIVNRSSKSKIFTVPYAPLFKMKVVTFKPNKLPTWLKEIPLTKPGSRPGA